MDSRTQTTFWTLNLPTMTANTPWVFCTHNAHKLEEVTAILGSQLEFRSLRDIQWHEAIPEPFETLEENSATKASTVARQTGLPCFAEDTGLFVEALDGQPGVHTARYAGEEANAAQNNEKLLSALQGQQQRAAYFKTVITLDWNQQVHTFTGICRGRIATQLSGNKGFGYDPLFIPEGSDVTFADMSSEAKQAISHRGKAFEQMKQFLQQQLS